MYSALSSGHFKSIKNIDIVGGTFMQIITHKFRTLKH